MTVFARAIQYHRPAAAGGREDTRLGRARSRAESDPLADRAEAEARSIRMAGYGGPAQPSAPIGQCLNGGNGGLRSNAIAVRPARASPSMRSPVRAIRR